MGNVPDGVIDLTDYFKPSASLELSALVQSIHDNALYNPMQPLSMAAKWHL